MGALTEEYEIRSAVDGLFTRPELRAEMSQRARASVDGLGLQRIVYQIEGLLKGVL
jgi:hypothetical protein